MELYDNDFRCMEVNPGSYKNEFFFGKIYLEIVIQETSKILLKNKPNLSPVFLKLTHQVLINF